MIERITSPENIAQDAIRLFTPMLENWRSARNVSHVLLEEAGRLSAGRILEDDFKELARYVITRDNRSTRIELGALVECLAFLRAREDAVMAAYTADHLAEELGLLYTANVNSPWPPTPETMQLPLSLRIAMDAVAAGLPADVARLKDVFVCFIHCLVLRDGHVTSDEIAHSEMIENVLHLLAGDPA